MKYFQQLAAGINVTPLLNALQRQPELWNQHPIRTKHPGTAHADVSDILCRFNDYSEFERTGDPTTVTDDKECIAFPAWEKLPQLRPIIFDLMRTIEEVGFDQIQRRLAIYLIKHQDADMCVRSSQAAIAAELGTAREVVFRALRALSAPRIVATGRLRIQLLDAVALRRIANGETSATVQD